MPPRTNFFQQLVHQVYKQLAPAGARITESAMIPDRVSGSPREVDILIEQDVAGHVVRVAIECRDRKGRSDVTWIDAVIGKYENLGIGHVVLVSASPFTKAAKAKAHSKGIECVTFAEFSATNLTDQAHGLRLCYISRQDSITDAYIVTDPPRDYEILQHAMVVYIDDAGNSDTLVGLVTKLYPFARDQLTAHVQANMDSILPQGMDFDFEHTFTIPVALPGPQPYFLAPNRFSIAKVNFVVKCRFVAAEKPVTNYWFRDKQVSVAHVTDTSKLLITRPRDTSGEDVT